MDGQRIGNARDYNRGLPAPVRMLYELGEFVHWRWSWPFWVAIASLLILGPFDAPIAAWIRALPVRGDIAQELKAWQQWGAIGSLLFTLVLIWRLDPARTRRVLDLAASALLVGLIATGLKMVIGRARPRLGDPGQCVPPWALHPVPDGEAIRLTSGWLGEDQLWSLPSSHTAFAVVLSSFLWVLYPRVRWVGVGMVVLVAFSRVHFGKHWPSDVVVGALVALLVAPRAVRGYWGVRALDWVWIRFVDRGATPSYPGIRDSGGPADDPRARAE